MFRSIWSKSLRDYRVAILGWGIGLGLLMVVGFATATPVVIAGFASFAALLSFLGDSFIPTPQGYITFRYMGTVVPLLLSIWLILAGARLVRGEEERGSLDVLLATPQPRVRVLLEKIVALLLAAVLIALLFALGVVAGEARIGHADLLRGVLAGLNVSLLAFFFGMVALLISQFTTSRSAAAGGASGLLLLSLVLVITGREVKGSWVQYLSPFYYYSLNRPLIPGVSATPLAALLLVGLAVLCAVLSLVLFARRDIGRGLFSWQRTQTDGRQQVVRSLTLAWRALSTRVVFLYTLSREGWTTCWWLLGMLFFCVACLFMALAIQPAFDRIVQGTPWLQQLLFDTPTNTNAALLGTILFTFMPALVVVFALALALSWAADLENGQLELLFSTPQARGRIMLERIAANVLLILLAPVLTWLVLIIGSALAHLNADQGRLMAASFSMLPPALITLGLVYALAGRIRYGAVLVILTAYLALAYIEETLEGMIQFPTWLMSLSIFHLYGNPTFLGMNWGNFLGMTGVALVLLIVGVVQFRVADVARG